MTAPEDSTPKSKKVRVQVTASLLNVWAEKEKKTVLRYFRGVRVTLDTAIVDVERLFALGVVKKVGDDETPDVLTAKDQARISNGQVDPVLVPETVPQTPDAEPDAS